MTTGVQAAAIVLCGGKTSRFGGEKAHAVVGGRAVIDRVVGVVGQVCGQVVAVTSAGKGDLRLPEGVTVVTDAHPGTGPLGGICTGLRHAASDLALVVGCDLPFLNEGLLRFLLGLAPGFDAVVPRLADGRLQTLHAVYARACLGEMERHLAAGRLPVWRVLHDLHLHEVEEEECRRYDPDLRSFFNLNTPEDLARANRLAARLDG
jgi:molybdopterin-guanine dinucleotide biosynthesis protein A